MDLFHPTQLSQALADTIQVLLFLNLTLVKVRCSALNTPHPPPPQVVKTGASTISIFTAGVKVHNFIFG